MATINIRVPPAGVQFKFSSEKDPSDVFDYDMDWKQRLQTDTINTATVTGERVTIDSSSVSGNIVNFFISGGTDGTIGTVTIKVVTSNATPRTFELSFNVRVNEK